jgi:hypothetical protein
VSRDDPLPQLPRIGDFRPGSVKGGRRPSRQRREAPLAGSFRRRTIEKRGDEPAAAKVMARAMSARRDLPVRLPDWCPCGPRGQMASCEKGWEEADMTDSPVSGREPGVMGGPEPDEKHADVLWRASSRADPVRPRADPKAGGGCEPTLA